MNNICVPVNYRFAIGETFAPPAFLWEQESGCCPPVCSPVNLTGCTAVFTAKQSPNSQLPPDILATTENGMLQINGPAGSIQMILPANYTETLQPFIGEWDLWVFYPPSPYSAAVIRLFGGKIEVFLAVGSP